MGRTDTTLLIVVAVMALLLGVVGQRSARAVGAAEAREQAALALAESLAVAAARVDTVYQRDTLRLWRQVRVLDTLTVTVEQWKHDTVRVVEYVARADSTVRACTAALRTCEQRDSLRVRQIHALEEAQAQHLRTHPSRLQRLAADAGKVLIGLGIGSVIR